MDTSLGSVSQFSQTHTVVFILYTLYLLLHNETKYERLVLTCLFKSSNFVPFNIDTLTSFSEQACYKRLASLSRAANIHQLVISGGRPGYAGQIMSPGWKSCQSSLGLNNWYLMGGLREHF